MYGGALDKPPAEETSLFGEEMATTLSAELWKYTIASKTWAQVSATGSPPPPLVEHTATVVDSKMIVFGGRTNGPTRSSELYVYDPAANKWERRQPLGGTPPRVSGHSAMFHPSSRSIYIFGGYQHVWAGFSRRTNLVRARNDGASRENKSPSPCPSSRAAPGRRSD